MRISINTNTIQNNLKTLSRLQSKLKSTQIASLSTAEMLKLVSDLAQINGQIKAFSTILKTQD